MLEDPRVNFAISTRGGKPGVDHLGLQTDTEEELEELRARARAADLSLADEGETTCCYANSEKHWVVDPQGIAWEHFHTLEDIRCSARGRPRCPAGAAGACCAGAAARQPAATSRKAASAAARAAPRDLGAAPGSSVTATTAHKLLAEALGTALLLAVVIGSGSWPNAPRAETSPSPCWPTPWRPSAASMS
jgi:hypothetical protein